MNLTVLSDNQQLTMSSLEIAELTGKEHKNVIRDIRVMLDELKDDSDLSHGNITRDIQGMLVELGGVLSFEDTHINPQNGQSYPIYKLPKRESLILVSGYSTELRAKIIDRWQQLEAVVIQPAAAPVFTPSPMVQAMEFAEATARMLHLEGSARLGLARKVTSIVAPHLLPALPVYAIDAPAGSTAGSSEPTASLTTLLKQKNVKISAAKANKVLQDLDILEQMFRSSSSGTDRAFWSITPLGMKYGKNVISPTNQLETQPHWFISQGDVLVNLVVSHI